MTEKFTRTETGLKGTFFNIEDVGALIYGKIIEDQQRHGDAEIEEDKVKTEWEVTGVNDSSILFKYNLKIYNMVIGGEKLGNQEIYGIFAIDVIGGDIHMEAYNLESGSF